MNTVFYVLSGGASATGENFCESELHRPAASTRPGPCLSDPTPTTSATRRRVQHGGPPTILHSECSGERLSFGGSAAVLRSNFRPGTTSGGVCWVMGRRCRGRGGGGESLRRVSGGNGGGDGGVQLGVWKAGVKHATPLNFCLLFESKYSTRLSILSFFH